MALAKVKTKKSLTIPTKSTLITSKKLKLAVVMG